MKKIIVMLMILTGIAEVVFISMLCKGLENLAFYAFLACGFFGWSALIVGGIDYLRSRNLY